VTPTPKHDYSKLDVAIVDAIQRHSGVRAAVLHMACRGLLNDASAAVGRDPLRVLERRLQKIKATGAIKVETGGYWFPVVKVAAAAEEHAR
jgi:hypothetical protein